MRIASSDVAMSSQHSYSEATVSLESLKTWGTRGNTFNQVDFTKLESDTVEISEQAKYLQMSEETEVSKSHSEVDSLFQLSESDKRRIELIQRLFKALTGKRIKFAIPQKVELKDPDLFLNIQDPKVITIQRLQLPQSVGWGLIYNKSNTHYEGESTSFSAHAAVKTEDGKEIKLDLQLNLSREFMSKNDIRVRAGDALIDPLVINYGSASASVTQKKYAFDIDADGALDQISFVGPGSGFLALDLNQDGIINDGKELFGPNSGDGFSDLANYDLDENGWIDENDAIYEKLRIWTKDADGNDQLLALGEKGIGAIYLGNVKTSFALKNTSNQLDAQIQKTGIFLRENGSAGTIQHVDLSV
ncbi:hypothetical protein [Desulfosporosinus meridiei]|uniref:VCBS repeat-containing protein n=1 Tax=Desulfosporosinus meridiei (strain ATCC BAA-275 / DSM 13257 / KCTC 12902 / NCIMB 13706 / S10) TaxID=768704 RepID=J7IME8_DESMD|nr:hypothetical protein [Desulfosporosinus meridiei]AFQ42760.1 hypothetical protein Desmer_0728 [Desulfosporosinus meridiei DSM 13257]